MSGLNGGLEKQKFGNNKNNFLRGSFLAYICISSLTIPQGCKR